MNTTNLTSNQSFSDPAALKAYIKYRSSRVAHSSKRDNIQQRLEILKHWDHQYRSALYNKLMFKYILSEVQSLFLKCEKTKEFEGRSELLLDISVLKIKLKKEITEAKF
jgi:hypothetical protein